MVKGIDPLLGPKKRVAFEKRQWVYRHNALQGTCGIIKRHLKVIADCPSTSPGAKQAAENIIGQVDYMAELLRHFRIEVDGTKSRVAPKEHMSKVPVKVQVEKDSDS